MSFSWAFGKDAEKIEKCPVCGSNEGFWFILKLDGKYAQCKGCGAEFLLCTIYQLKKKNRKHGITSFLYKKKTT